MNKFYSLIMFILLIISVLLIIYKKYDIFIYYLLFSLIVYYKSNIKEGNENISVDKLKKTNELLDKLIRLFNINNQDCVGEFIPQSCDRDCGYGMRDEIYNIIKQPGEKGYKCAHKEGKTKSVPCMDKLCESGDFCMSNKDCANNLCDNTFKCANLECSKEIIDNCNTYDKCNSLNTESSGAIYKWENNKCNVSFKSGVSVSGGCSSSGDDGDDGDDGDSGNGGGGGDANPPPLQVALH